MTRTVYIMYWIIVGTIYMGICAIAVSLVTKGGKYAHRVARAWGRSILYVAGIDVDVKGLEHIDRNRSYVYMSNHMSMFDIPVLLACLRVQFRWIAKVELFGIPLFGRIMTSAGYIPVDRSDRRAAFRSLKLASEKIRNGVSVMIFPEGTRSDDGNIRAFKNGGFIMAIDSGCPILPLVIHGTGSIMRKNEKRIRRGRVFLEILEPVETSDCTRKEKNELIEKVRTRMCEAYERNKKDLYGC